MYLIQNHRFITDSIKVLTILEYYVQEHVNGVYMDTVSRAVVCVIMDGKDQVVRKVQERLIFVQVLLKLLNYLPQPFVLLLA